MSALIEYPFATRSGAAMAVADDDFFYTATGVSIGLGTALTLTASEGEYARTVTCTLTDADSSVTAFKVYLTGEDVQGRVIQETLTFAGAGTETVESNYAFRRLTSVTYDATGVAAGADTLKVGFGDILGVPVDFAAVPGVILRARVDTTVYEDISSGAGTWNSTYNTWETLGGVIPNGSRQYAVQVSA
jgi:hypothetical protein